MKKRLRYILLKSYWEGEVSRADLVDMFDIAPAQVTRDFSALRKEYPGAVIYDMSVRRYVPDRHIEKYVNAYSFDEYYSVSLISNKYACVMNNQNRAIDAHVYRVINMAIRSFLGVKISYNSMNDPTGLKSRVIYPHSIIHSGFRWHVRAYEQQSKSFKDFNLARINLAPTLSSKKLKAANSDNDTFWNTMVTLLLTPNQQLNGPQRKVIAAEHNGNDESMVIQVKTRAALLLYTLHLYEVTDFSETPALAQHLQIGNLSEVRQYLPSN